MSVSRKLARAGEVQRALHPPRPDVAAEDRMVLETVLSELVTNVIQSNPQEGAKYVWQIRRTRRPASEV